MAEAYLPSQHQGLLLVEIDELFWVTFVEAFPNLGNELIALMAGFSSKREPAFSLMSAGKSLMKKLKPTPNDNISDEPCLNRSCSLGQDAGNFLVSIVNVIDPLDINFHEG